MLSFLFIAQTALHAESLSPEGAVALALQRNLSLAAGASRITAAEGLRIQAGLKPNPRLILQSENTRFNNATPFRYAQDTDNFAYLSKVIKTAGKRGRRVEVANQNVRFGEVELFAQRLQLTGRVLTAYWAAVSAQPLEASLAEGANNLERAVQYDRDRVREGSLPESDLIRVQLEHEQVAVTYQNARQDSRRLLSWLFREMGIPEQQSVTLSGNLEAVPSLSTANLEEAIERRPDVKIARQTVEQARTALHLQKANSVPDPEVLFGYKRTAGFDTLIAGIQINLPVHNRNQGAIASAVADETGSVAALQGARIAARTEITALEGEYVQKQQIANELFPKMREQSAETIRIADAVYREGASDLLRLLDAQRIRLQTEPFTFTLYQITAKLP
jgi:cobalt-zinc-cadmium efflux system outer membrane protein